MLVLRALGRRISIEAKPIQCLVENAFALSRPTVLASAAQMLIDNKIKLPAQIAEELLLNASDVESLCGLPPGTLQNKVLAFKLAMSP
jgi:hypothetical protein